MRTLIYLEPHEHARLTADYLKAFPLSTEIDLIEAITGHPNLTHAWNEFRLKCSVVERVLTKAQQAFCKSQSLNVNPKREL